MSEHVWYTSLQELEAAESEGYVTVAVFHKVSPKGVVRITTRVTGLYDTKKRARNAASAFRARYNRKMRKHPYRDDDLLTVNVEAVWKP